MIEDLDAKIDLVVEIVTGSETRMSERFDRLEGTVSVMQKDMMDMKKDITIIQKDMTDVRSLLYRHDERFQKCEEEIESLKVVSRRS